MPYIAQKTREKLDPFLEQAASVIETEGDLNYCIFKLARLMIKKTGKSYHNLARCSSAMEHAKLEWYRRVVAPYEDEKIKENGDVE